MQKKTKETKIVEKQNGELEKEETEYKREMKFKELLEEMSRTDQIY